MPNGVVILGHKPCKYGTINPDTATMIDRSDLVNSEGQRAIEAYCSVENYPVRVRVDGGVPTATDGHLYNNGEKFIIRGFDAVSNLTFIDTPTGSSTVRITILF